MQDAPNHGKRECRVLTQYWQNVELFKVNSTPQPCNQCVTVWNYQLGADWTALPEACELHLHEEAMLSKKM